MEIERKFLISKENLPADLDSYPHHRLEQGYLSTAPVVRIRKEDDNYYLTFHLQKNPMNICVQKLTESSFPKPAILSRKKMGLLSNWMYLIHHMKDFSSRKWNFLLKSRHSSILRLHGSEKMLQTLANIITAV